MTLHVYAEMGNFMIYKFAVFVLVVVYHLINNVQMRNTWSVIKHRQTKAKVLLKPISMQQGENWKSKKIRFRGKM